MWAEVTALVGRELSPSSVPSGWQLTELAKASRPHRHFLSVLSKSDDANMGGSSFADHNEGKADDEGADRFAEVSSLGGVCGVLCLLGSGKLMLRLAG